MFAGNEELCTKIIVKCLVVVLVYVLCNFIKYTFTKFDGKNYIEERSGATGTGAS